MGLKMISFILWIGTPAMTMTIDDGIDNEFVVIFHFLKA